MPLIQRRLTYASAFTSGLTSDGRKEESRFTPCSISRLKSQLSSSLRRRSFMTLTGWMLSHTSQAPFMCLTGRIVTSKDFTTSKRLVLSSLSAPRAVSDTSMSDGRGGCPRMSFRTPLSGLPFISPGVTIRQCSVESSITMRNKTASSYSLQTR